MNHQARKFWDEEVVTGELDNLRLMFKAILPEDSQRDGAQFLVFAIDEAGVLFDDTVFLNPEISKDEGILYNNVRAIFSRLVDSPVWCLPLSNNPKILSLEPHGREAGSSEQSFTDQLECVPPFTVFPMDVVMSKNLRQKKLTELEKSLEDYSCLAHLATMGRIFWDQFGAKSNAEETKDLVLYKLLSGSKERFIHRLKTPCSVIDSTVLSQCFAVMSSRIPLDDCTATVEGAQLIKASVCSHLRLLKAFDTVNGVASTTAPSEPLISQAVSSMLWEEGIWHKLIEVVARRLFYQGLVTGKGIKGEFYVLLLLTLARDATVQAYRTIPRPAVSSIPRGTSRVGTRLPAASHFTLKSFFKALLVPEFFT